MSQPDVQRVVDDFISAVACPLCTTWLRHDDTRTMLERADADGLWNTLEAIHELTCGVLLTPEREAVFV